MGIIKFYIRMIKSKTLEAYSTRGLEGAIKKFEIIVGLILLVGLLSMTAISVPVNPYLFVFFGLFFLFVTWLVNTDRISFIFLGIPYLILLIVKFVSPIIDAISLDDNKSNDEYVEFKKIVNVFVTAILMPILILISVVVWMYFVSYTFDFLVYVIELLVEIANKY